MTILKFITGLAREERGAARLVPGFQKVIPQARHQLRLAGLDSSLPFGHAN